MRLAVLAALAAAFLLPAAAQTSAPRGETRPATKAAQAPAEAQATATTPRERARLAKAQNRDSRCLTKQKDRQKKATAT